MKHSAMQTDTGDRTIPLPFTPERMFRHYLKNRLKLFEAGSVRLELPNGAIIQHQGTKAGPAAVIVVERWALLRKLLLEGEIGLARGYVDGDWTTPDLTAVLEFGLHNEDSLSSATRGLGFAHFVNRLVHRRNANTRRGSRRNIAAHYDLGNRFYELWLDPSMSYSSGIYAHPEEALKDAQERKLTRAVDLLDLGGGETVLEIGCGWGGLARRIASAGAASVHGITLSNEQMEYARAQTVTEYGSGTTNYELCDYRSLSQRYDRIVSIEMFEAVGERYWPTFFDQLRASLSNDGVSVLQIITIANSLEHFNGNDTVIALRQTAVVA